MGRNCACPLGTSLPSISEVACKESFGQIQKVIFQRINSASGVKNTMTETTIKALSDWQALKTASDGTKIVVSPFINNPADAGGDARTQGGDNTTLSGITEVTGRNPVSFSAELRNIPQDIVKTMKELQCESDIPYNLGVFLVDEYGRIECVQSGSGANVTYSPIPIFGMFIGDKIHGNFDGNDVNAISWNYAANYSDDLAIVTPSFNPLSDL